MMNPTTTNCPYFGIFSKEKLGTAPVSENLRDSKFNCKNNI